MSQPAVQFLFDFGSPNAYLCHKVIPRIEDRCGVRFEYLPILLGGLFKLSNNRSPVEAFKDIPNKQAYNRLELERFVARHRLDRFQMNPHFPVNTLKIMRGAVAAQRMGCFDAYVDAVYAAMWEQGLNLDETPVIAKVLADAGLDAEGLIQLTQDAQVKQTLLDNTQRAWERGAFGSPTFFVGDDMWFGKDRLRDVEEQILALVKQ
jgi:2-hydroxychromene-2-carboxylate isomerase